MRENLIVSIIVPAYNEEKYLEECLVSIKNQAYSSIELVIVDDGSTDRTTEIAKKYADVFVTQKHQGPGIARNKGAGMAKGSILVFIDADMYLDKNYIKDITDPIIKRIANATFTKKEFVANPENIWSKCNQIDNRLPSDKRIPLTLISSNKFRAIKKTFFQEIAGYKTSSGYGEDEVLPEKFKVFPTNAICYHYNPDTLKDVFIAARWMGRSRKAIDLIRYSVINSVKNSIIKILEGAPFSFLIYKIIFDFGIFCGILNRNSNQNYSK